MLTFATRKEIEGRGLLHWLVVNCYYDDLKKAVEGGKEDFYQKDGVGKTIVDYVKKDNCGSLCVQRFVLEKDMEFKARAKKGITAGQMDLFQEVAV